MSRARFSVFLALVLLGSGCGDDVLAPAPEEPPAAQTTKAIVLRGHLDADSGAHGTELRAPALVGPLRHDGVRLHRLYDGSGTPLGLRAGDRIALAARIDGLDVPPIALGAGQTGDDTVSSLLLETSNALQALGVDDVDAWVHAAGHVVFTGTGLESLVWTSPDRPTVSLRASTSKGSSELRTPPLMQAVHPEHRLATTRVVGGDALTLGYDARGNAIVGIAMYRGDGRPNAASLRVREDVTTVADLLSRIASLVTEESVEERIDPENGSVHLDAGSIVVRGPRGARHAIHGVGLTEVGRLASPLHSLRFETTRPARDRVVTRATVSVVDIHGAEHELTIHLAPIDEARGTTWEWWARFAGAEVVLHGDRGRVQFEGHCLTAFQIDAPSQALWYRSTPDDAMQTLQIRADTASLRLVEAVDTGLVAEPANVVLR